MKKTRLTISTMPKPKKPPSLLRTLRGSNTLRAVAAAAEIPLPTYWEIESGRQLPGVRIAIKIARFYETTVEAIWGGVVNSD